jgi:hypothetical protein
MDIGGKAVEEEKKFLNVATLGHENGQKNRQEIKTGRIFITNRRQKCKVFRRELFYFVTLVSFSFLS